jgi:hypothetical protein
MKTVLVHFMCFLLVLFLFSNTGCKQSPVGPHTEDNLLSNSSFEINNNPTLEGWQSGNQQLAELVHDAPPNGGSWSLQLTSDGAPTSGYVYTPVINLKSGDIVRLSAFVRTNSKSGGKGIIYLSYNNHTKSASSSDTLWKKISVTDTLTLTQRDTLWVTLSSPITERTPFQQLFDLVELRKIVN